MTELRPPQVDCLKACGESLRRQRREGKRRRTLVVACVAFGKTEVFIEMCIRIANSGGRSLVLVHSKSLVTQTARRLRARGLRVGVERAAETVEQLLDVDVVVCSVQSMVRRLEKYLPGAFGLLVCDEAHHTASATQRKILDHFVSAAVCGFTGTPDRMDGTPLSDVFDDVAYTYDIADGVRDGYLVAPELVDIAVESLDLSSVKFRGGEPAAAELEAELLRDATMHAICRGLAQEAKGRRICLFLPGVASVNAAPDMLAQYGFRAAGITGATPEVERKRIIAAFEAGEYDVLANCMTLTEGFDCPSIDCVAIARPTSSRGLLVQMAGRGLRLHPGKTSCVVINFSPGKIGPRTLIGPSDALGSHGFAHRTIGSDWRVKAREAEAAKLAAERAEAEALSRRVSTIGVALAATRMPLVDVLRASLGANHATCDSRPVTEAQLCALKKAGFPAKQITNMSEAQLCFAIMAERRESGLCSYKVGKILESLGLRGDVDSDIGGWAMQQWSRNGHRPTRAMLSHPDLQRVDAGEPEPEDWSRDLENAFGGAA